ncbi:MAG TPA: protoporphyrinogen oxidase [Mycobacteriales bacterium]|nr:protoporphyrinogen oxidase [Mycobacteriales bacterium]
MTRVVVIGAGIAGLSAALAVSREAPPGTRVTIVDGASKVGGKLRVSAVGGLPVDEGAETFLARQPEGVELVRAVGLGDQLIHPLTNEASVAVDGVCHRLPARTVLGVPGDRSALRRSGLLSEEGLALVGADRPEPAPLGDPSVGHYVARRLGREVVDKLVDPLLGGVYAGRADGLSLRATMPALAAALDEQGGKLVAAARSVVDAAPPDAGPAFAALDGGMGVLPEAVARASGADVRLRLPIRRIERTTGGGFRLVGGPVPDPVALVADAVVVAAPAGKAAGLLEGLAPWAAHELAAMEYASIGIVTLAFPAAALAGLTGSGLLVPSPEGGGPVKAVTYSSNKWAHLAGHDVAIVRASVGRHREARVLHRDDTELVRLVLGQLTALAGIRSAPIAHRVTRWGGALPQYAPGHLERVRRIRADVGRVPGLAVCGAAFDGVGVPACVRSGYAAAAQVVEHLRESSRGRGWEEGA